MPYIIQDVQGEAAGILARQPRPFGPGCAAGIADKTAHLVVTGSTVQDPGDDWVRFEMFDHQHALIATTTIPGH